MWEIITGILDLLSLLCFFDGSRKTPEKQNQAEGTGTKLFHGFIYGLIGVSILLVVVIAIVLVVVTN